MVALEAPPELDSIVCCNLVQLITTDKSYEVTGALVRHYSLTENNLITHTLIFGAH